MAQLGPLGGCLGWNEVSPHRHQVKKLLFQKKGKSLIHRRFGREIDDLEEGASRCG